MLNLLQRQPINNFVFISLAILVAGQTYAQETSSNDEFALALELFKNEQYQAARSSFDDIANQDLNGEISYYQAMSTVLGGQEDGMARLSAFVANYPNHNLAKRAFKNAGDYFYDNGAYLHATKFYEEQKIEKSDELLFRLGRSYFELNKTDQAKKVWQKIRPGSLYHPEASYFIGFLSYEEGSFENAIPKAKIAMNSKEFGNEAKLLLVSSLSQLERYNELIKILEDDAELRENSDMMAYLARAYYSVQDYHKAVKSYQTYFDGTEEVEYGQYYYAGYSAYQQSDITSSVDWLKQAALAEDTLGGYASYYLGLAYEEQDNFSFAANAYANTLRFETQLNEHANYHQGRVLMNNEQYELAIPVFLEYVAQYKQGEYLKSVQEMLTAAYEHSNNYDLAMAHIESLDQLSESIKEIYQRVSFVKAIRYYNKESHGEAARLFDKALIHRVNPLITSQAYYWMGETLVQLEQYEDAIYYYESVDGDGSELDGLSLYGAGYAYYNNQQYNLALEKFEGLAETAVIEDEYVADAYERIGDCYFIQKSYPEAISSYLLALDKGNQNLGHLYNRMGLISNYMGQREKARKYWEKVLEVDGNYENADEVTYLLAELDMKDGRSQVALTGFEKMIRQYPGSSWVPNALVYIGVIYDNKSESSKSVLAYRKIIDLYPQHELANSAIMALQEKNAAGAFDEFNTYFEIYQKANPEGEAIEQVLFEKASSLYYNQQYAEAELDLGKYLERYPNGVFRYRAQSFFADVLYRQSKLEEAINAFEMLRVQGKHKDLDKVNYRLADLYGQSGDSNRSKEYYRLLAETSASVRYQLFGYKGMMQGFFNDQRYDSAIHYGEIVIDHRKSSASDKMRSRMVLARSYDALDSLELAFEYYMGLMENTPEPNAAEPMYRSSHILYRQGHVDRSLATLFDLVENYPGQQQWIDEAYLLMVDIYIDKEEMFQAKATLNSLIENVENQEVLLRAQTKLDELQESLNKGDESGN